MSKRKIFTIATCALISLSLLAACQSSGSAKSHASTASKSEIVQTGYRVGRKDVANAKKLLINSRKWHYNAKNKVYYQVKIKYGTKTKSNYESMGIYIPAKYVNAKKSGKNTYRISINKNRKVKGYTAATAPIVMPINTPGYSAQQAPTGYDQNSSKYTKAGFVYVLAGCRGLNQTDKSNGSSPWGVTDLKAAIRTLRLNQGRIAGNTKHIFTFGHSGGGAQSAILGSSGNSKAYLKYLKAIGAPLATIKGKATSDATTGAMCWCPITSLDTANEAYEWNMGQYATTGTRASGTWTKALSDDMAAKYAEYINELGLKDSSGQKLTLEKSSSGIYTAGSYAEYLKNEVEQSLNNFLKDTKFPYKATNTNGPSGAAQQMGSGQKPSGQKPSGKAPNGKKPSGKKPSGKPSGQAKGKNKSNGKMPQMAGSNNSSKTYKTVQSYISSLNKNGTWVKYDAKTNTATITSLEAFVKHCKEATKDVGAFDGISRQQTENKLFAFGKQKSGHFDAIMSELLQENATKYAKLKNYQSSYASAFASDLKQKDALGSSIKTRLNMYNPMYYLSSYYDGYNTSKVAKYWRIRTGIDQTDTALTVETNLALALKQDSQVKTVNFATVWGQGHTEAERKGNNETNFIKWVNKCLKK